MEYPNTWERAAETIDGVVYKIRPIRADDLQLDRDFLVGLSPQSRYNRMMSVMKEPPLDLLERFVQVDYENDMAFVALTGEGSQEHMIGVARYAADPSILDCEFAVAVADKWQGRGVGAALTRLLFDYARERGVQRLHGDILASNRRMVELVHWLGMSTRFTPEEGDREIVASSSLGTP
jgi:acetyltransferase